MSEAIVLRRWVNTALSFGSLFGHQSDVVTIIDGDLYGKYFCGFSYLYEIMFTF